MRHQLEVLENPRHRKRKMACQHPYFATGIKAMVEQKRIDLENKMVEAEENQKGLYDNLGIDQLKQMIFNRTGSQPKVRARPKLLSLLRRYDDVSSSQPEEQEDGKGRF
jgi:hypothetical protein